jgi:8-oxo-dGTP diphosphatase
VPDPSSTAKERGGPVRAAGGIVWRRAGPGREVLLVYRRSHDDWSFPKGKVEPGETEEAAALREVEEETGLRCALGDPLGAISYRDGRGRPKTVCYWSMEATGTAAASHEIDAVRWVELEGAAAALTYPRDREMLEAFARISAAQK